MAWPVKRCSVVTFTQVGGRDVPSHPWPQAFYVSGYDFNSYRIEVRPLTVTGLAKGIARNLVTMSYWRLLHALFRLGFITTEPGMVLSWRDWNWHPLRERAKRRHANARSVLS